MAGGWPLADVERDAAAADEVAADGRDVRGAVRRVPDEALGLRSLQEGRERLSRVLHARVTPWVEGAEGGTTL